MREGKLLAYNLQFFAKEGPGGEKTEDATTKKLQDARKEGQVAKSTDLNSAILLLVLHIIHLFRRRQDYLCFHSIFHNSMQNK